MKMKKFLAMTLTASLSLSLLSACGDNGDANGSVNNSGTADNTASVGTTGSTTSDATVFHLGGTGPLTGSAAIYGNAAKYGAQIAVDEINALGGEIQFELNYQDDAHDAEKAVNAYNTLKDWGMQIFLGSVTSIPCVATSAESYNDHIFLMTPSASSTDVLGGVADPLTGTVNIARKDNSFQMCFMDPNQGAASAQYISDNTLGSKLAVIYKNDDVYSTGVYNSFKSKADELGLEIVSTTTFTSDSQTDFSVQLSDAKNSGADLVFLPMYYDAASLILTQADSMGYTPGFFGVDGMDGILGVEGFDTSLAEGVMLLTPFNADADDTYTSSFVTKYQETYGDIPNQFAADSYDAVYAIYQALEQSGATADLDASSLCDLLIEKFTSDEFVFNGLTGVDMTWDASGAVSKAPKGMMIEDGTYVGMN